MAKITRKTQKIFADSATTNEITTFGTAQAVTPNHSRDLDDIQNANYLGGWATAVEADKAPYEEDTNGLFYLVTKQLAYLFQAGVAEWDSGTTYYTNDFCRVGRVVYGSLQDNNTGKDPTSEPTYWKAVMDGDWTLTNTSVSTATAIGDYTIDISSTIPNDGYAYECIFRGNISRTDTSDNNTSYYVYVDTKYWFYDSRDGSTRTGDTKTNGFQFTIILPSNERSIKVQITNTALDLHALNLVAYRRLGA